MNSNVRGLYYWVLKLRLSEIRAQQEMPNDFTMWYGESRIYILKPKEQL